MLTQCLDGQLVSARRIGNPVIGVIHLFSCPYFFTKVTVIVKHPNGHRTIIDYKVTRAWLTRGFDDAWV